MGIQCDGGTSSRINIASGQLQSLKFTFGTWACVYNWTTAGNEKTLWANNNGGNAQIMVGITSLFTLNIGGTLRTAATTVPADVTVLSVLTKTTGTTTPRAHLYRFDTGVWVHENMSGTHANFATMTSMLIGALNTTGSESFQGDIFCLAFWEARVMGDAECERLVRGRWLETSPDYLRQFDTRREIVTCRSLGRKGGRDTTLSTPIRGTIVDPAGFRMDRQIRKGR